MNFEEVLKSPELTELIFKKSGLSKEEWDDIIREADYDLIEEYLGELLRETESIIYSDQSTKISLDTYRLVQLCGVYFWKFNSDPGKWLPGDPELNWEGPQKKLEFFYGLWWFSNSAEAIDTDLSIHTSLDHETIFKIISKNFCPITLNGVKYIHDGERYVKAE